MKNYKNDLDHVGVKTPAQLRVHRIRFLAFYFCAFVVVFLVGASLYQLLVGYPKDGIQKFMLTLSIIAWELLHWILYVVAGISIAKNMEEWSAVVRVKGKSTLRNVSRVLQLNQRRHFGQNYLVGASRCMAFSFVLSVVWLFLDWSILAPLIVLGVAFAFGFFSLSAMPPFVLFLSTSKPESIWLMDRIHSVARPHSVVSLLDTGESQIASEADQFKAYLTSPSSFEPYQKMAATLKPNIFRTTDLDEWHGSLHGLVDMVSIVVLDTRQKTPDVMYEAQYLVAPDRLRKVYFLVGANHEQPVLDSIKSQIVSLKFNVDPERVGEPGQLLKKLDAIVHRYHAIRVWVYRAIVLFIVIYIAADLFGS